MVLKHIPLWLSVIITTHCVDAQPSASNLLFQTEEPLVIRLHLPLKAIKKNTNDSTYLQSTLYYKSGTGWDSIRISIRARGIYRKEHCYFTPLKIKIDKAHAKGTLFAGNKSLKLVLPCQQSKNNSDLAMKEYICYQLYEQITPYAFKTRLLDITLDDSSGKQLKSFHLTGFFIEDDDLLAKRFHAKAIDSLRLHPLQLQDTGAVRHDLFQMMIANTDWSTTFYHNVKTLKTMNGKYIPVTYDFDMSGFVNAPYARADESLNLSSVRQRLYRGYCRDEKILKAVREQYLHLEPTIYEVIGHHENYVSANELADMKNYLEEFFDILKNDGQFRDQVLLKCRRN